LKVKKILTVFILIFVAVAVGFIISGAFREKTAPFQSAAAGVKKICNPNNGESCSPDANNQGQSAGQPSQPEAGKPSKKVIAYYFHGNFRCSTCRTIEAYSQEAVQTGFSDALKSGLLEWKVVNVEEQANRHFIKDYQLYSKSLVLVKMQGDKQVEWKNLDRIWELVQDKPAFIKYVQDEISGYLKK
jgi:hypothetical protein